MFLEIERVTHLRSCVSKMQLLAERRQRSHSGIAIVLATYVPATFAQPVSPVQRRNNTYKIREEVCEISLDKMQLCN